jgi:hypothetical protein
MKGLEPSTFCMAIGRSEVSSSRYGSTFGKRRDVTPGKFGYVVVDGPGGAS